MNGGSVGGYTPEPTPPTPTNYPYDLDNISFSDSFVLGGHGVKGYPEKKASYYKGVISISGVQILDSVNVASVKAIVHVTPGTNTWTNATDTSYTTHAADIEVDISGIMTQQGGSVDVYNETIGSSIKYILDFAAAGNYYPTLQSTTTTLTVTKINVYNANGVVIQEWTP